MDLLINPDVMEVYYSGLKKKVNRIRECFGRPLTLTEKILFAHLKELPGQAPARGKAELVLKPDRVAMQDATAQMAVLQFMVTGLDTVKLPVSIHCDHLIQARAGAEKDLALACESNREVYEFLKSAAGRYGMDFWEPGSGIIHQIVLEQYAVPGQMMLGTDSHTPNAGGLGMLAIGVGGADAVDAMAGESWALRYPNLIGVHLKGAASGFVSPKDVILKVLEELTVKGGTGCIVEYFGEGAGNLSCSGKATVTNMGAELGATTSVFPYDPRMSMYLRSTGRAGLAEQADRAAAYLVADSEVLAEPEKYYDRIVEIDLSALEPGWAGPHSPDRYRAVSGMKEVAGLEFPDAISAALIGSCTNSSYEDLSRAADVARQAVDKGLKVSAPLYITPGSEQIRKTLERDGIVALFEEAGATLLANACGPCIGQWDRQDIKSGENNTIVTSYNRNFARRNDGNASTCAFVGSPELVTAAAFAGKISFNPETDALTDSCGNEFKFRDPQGSEYPDQGFVFNRRGYVPAQTDLSGRRQIKVEVSPESERLALLEPFLPPQEDSFKDLLLLLKAQGKCTTDHISQAGKWLKYRGHLDNISNNLFLGAVNGFNGKAGCGLNALTGEEDVTFPELARYYNSAGRGWIVVADENYGEGSSREHAAMEPRHLGCRAVIARSFARIAETNLKKQGVLALVFVDPEDYEKIEEQAAYDISGIQELSPGTKLILKARYPSGSEADILLSHSLTAEQVRWFLAGSALNLIRSCSGATESPC